MPQAIQEAESLTDFTSDPARILEKLRRTGSPILLTQEGESGVVVQDAASYQRFLEMVDELETIAAVKQSMEDVAAGRHRPAREVLEEIAVKYQLPKVVDE